MNDRPHWLTSPWLGGLLFALPIPILFFSQHMPAWAMLAALSWLAAAYLLRSSVSKRWLSQTPADLLLLLLVALLPLGLWASVERPTTLMRTYALLADIALFFAIAIQAENRALRWSGWLLLLAGLAMVVATVPGTHFFPGQKLPLIQKSVYQLLPSGLTLPGDENGFNPNMTGGILALFMPPALALSLRAENGWQRMLAIITWLALATALFLTQSRGAIIGSVIAVAVVTITLVRPLRWLWWLGGVLTTGVMITQGAKLLQTYASSDIGSGVNSMAQRVELWSRAIYMGMDFAFSGVGMGLFPKVMPLLYPTFQVKITADVPHAHNVYLQALAEMGYPGLLLYLAFFMVLLFVLIRRVRLASGQHRALAAGLLGSLSAFLVHGIVDVPTYSPLSAIVVWGMFGVMMAVALAGDRLPSPFSS